MCGICGSTDDPRGARAAAMNRRLLHRGPDDGGVRVDDLHPVALGARRLSVIDVEGGHQPFANEDGTIWAVLNGEIYNYPQLRTDLLARGHDLSSRCDTEALVHLYEDFGPDLVHALEGMFAFAIWDGRRGEVILARDRFGEKPLFYETVGGVLSFSSELAALREGRPGGTIDEVAVQGVLTLGYVPGPHAMYEDVRQLPAGHLLRWSVTERRAAVSRYWQMPPAAATARSAPHRESLVAETEDLLDRSVASRLVADVPVGVLLSGGLDSTLVASLARRHTDQLKTFTVAYDAGSVNEDVPARATARLLRSDHHELRLTSAWVAANVPAILTSIDQPIADPALIALTGISRLAREHVTVAVGGEGADELFFGYPRYRWLARARRVERVLPATAGAAGAHVARRLAGAGRGRRVAEVLQPASPLDRNLDWVTDGRMGRRAAVGGPRLADGGADRLYAGLADRWLGDADAATAASRLDQSSYLCDDILQKADRASMACSLEMRTPYLDRALAEFSATVPAGVHMAGGGKYLLRHVLRRVLPAAGTGRTKTAFRVPLATWLRGPLEPVVREHVLSGTLVRDGWVGRAAAAAAVARLAAGDDSAASELWPLVCCGAWLDARE